LSLSISVLGFLRLIMSRALGLLTCVSRAFSGDVYYFPVSRACVVGVVISFSLQHDY